MSTPELSAMREVGYHALEKAKGIRKGARLEADNSFTVASDSYPGVRYRVVVRHVHPDGLVHLTCICSSGRYRDWAPLPCWHSAKVAQRLARTKLAELRGGLAYRVS